MEPQNASVHEIGFLDYALMVIKILAYIITFAFVLVCGVIAKSLAMLLISNVKSRPIAWCNNNDGKFINMHTKEIALKRMIFK